MTDFYIRHLPLLSSSFHINRIITDTDLIRYLSQNPSIDAFSVLLEELPSQKVHTVNEDETIFTAIQTMYSYNISSLPILTDKNPTGIITVRDLIQLDDLWETVPDIEIDPFGENFGELITKETFISPSHSFWQILDQLVDRGSRNLLVSSDKEQVSGMISTLLLLAEIIDYYENIQPNEDSPDLVGFMFSRTLESLMVPRPVILIPPVTINEVRSQILETKTTAILIGRSDRPIKIISEKDLFFYLEQELRKLIHQETAEPNS